MDLLCFLFRNGDLTGSGGRFDGVGCSEAGGESGSAVHGVVVEPSVSSGPLQVHDHGAPVRTQRSHKPVRLGERDN